MNIRKKAWRSELAWIGLLLILVGFIDFLLFGKSSVLQETIGIQIHDTYYAISGSVWLAILFVLIATIVYAFKEVRHAYRRLLPSLILIVLIAALLYVIFRWHYVTTQTGGWTVYSPLSESEMQEIASAAVDRRQRTNFTFIATEVLLGAGLLLLSIRTVRVAK